MKIDIRAVRIDYHREQSESYVMTKVSQKEKSKTRELWLIQP